MNSETPAGRRRSLLILFLIIMGMILIVSIAAAAALAALLTEEDEPLPFRQTRYEETFIEAGTWGVGAEVGPDGTFASGTLGVVDNGVYELQLFGEDGLYWATAGEEFGDGRYEVDVNFVDGSLDNAGGIVFMFDSDAFYFFALRGDGNALIARCADGCAEFAMLGNQGWFATDADWGVNSQNRLQVEAAAGELSFYVNDDLVATVMDDSYEKGDVGILVASGAEGEAHFLFDNILVVED